MKKKNQSVAAKVATANKTRKEAEPTTKSSVTKRTADLVKEKPTTRTKLPDNGVAAKKPAANVASSQDEKPKAQFLKKASVKEWLGIVRDHIAKTAEDGAPTGACSVPDPNGGPNLCVEMTQEACGSPAVKGTWIGGNC